MKTRTDVLQHLIDRYGLKRYLEIGVQNPIQNFDKIRCEYKVGVDPDPNAHATFCMTSDEFFRICDKEFDICFIDGLHTAEQVKRDFENAMKVVRHDGFIVMHDCNPEKEEHTIVPRPTPTGHWNGDVWKFAKAFHESTATFTVDVDNGCMVHQKKEGLKWFTWMPEPDWDIFDKNRNHFLHLVSWNEFVNI